MGIFIEMMKNRTEKKKRSTCWHCQAGARSRQQPPPADCSLSQRSWLSGASTAFRGASSIKRVSESGHGAKPELTRSLQPTHPALTKRASHDLQSHITPCCDLLSEGAQPQDRPSRASSEVRMKHPEAPAER